MLIDLLSSDSIYDRVERWWHYDIKIRQKYVDIAGDISAKAMCHEGKEGWCVEGEDYANMWPTCAERLESGFTGGETENSTEYLNIRKGNGYNIKNEDWNSTQAIDDIDLDAGTRQTSKTHVFTVGMRNDLIPTEGQSQNEKYKGNNRNKWPH